MGQFLDGHFVGSGSKYNDEFDTTAVIEMPDIIAIKAFELLCMAVRGLRFSPVTPFMSFEEGAEAMQQVGKIDNKAPV